MARLQAIAFILVLFAALYTGPGIALQAEGTGGVGLNTTWDLQGLDGYRGGPRGLPFPHLHHVHRDRPRHAKGLRGEPHASLATSRRNTSHGAGEICCCYKTSCLPWEAHTKCGNVKAKEGGGCPHAIWDDKGGKFHKVNMWHFGAQAPLDVAGRHPAKLVELKAPCMEEVPLITNNKKGNAGKDPNTIGENVTDKKTPDAPVKGNNTNVVKDESIGPTIVLGQLKDSDVMASCGLAASTGKVNVCVTVPGGEWPSKKTCALLLVRGGATEPTGDLIVHEGGCYAHDVSGGSYSRDREVRCFDKQPCKDYRLNQQIAAVAPGEYTVAAVVERGDVTGDLLVVAGKDVAGTDIPLPAVADFTKDRVARLREQFKAEWDMRWQAYKDNGRDAQTYLLCVGLKSFYANQAEECEKLVNKFEKKGTTEEDAKTIRENAEKTADAIYQEYQRKVRDDDWS